MDDKGGVMKKKTWKIQLYRINNEGDDRSETIKADIMSESTHGNIIFQNKNGASFDLVGIASRGAFESIKEVT